MRMFHLLIVLGVAPASTAVAEELPNQSETHLTSHYPLKSVGFFLNEMLNKHQRAEPKVSAGSSKMEVSRRLRDAYKRIKERAASADPDTLVRSTDSTNELEASEDSRASGVSTDSEILKASQHTAELEESSLGSSQPST